MKKRSKLVSALMSGVMMVSTFLSMYHPVSALVPKDKLDGGKINGEFTIVDDYWGDWSNQSVGDMNEPTRQGGLGAWSQGTDRDVHDMQATTITGKTPELGPVYCIEANVRVASYFKPTGGDPAEDPATGYKRSTYVYAGVYNNDNLKVWLSYCMYHKLPKNTCQVGVWQTLGQIKPNPANFHAQKYFQFQRDYVANPNHIAFKGVINMYYYVDKVHDAQRVMSFDYKFPEAYIGIKSKIDKQTGKPLSGVKFGIYSDSKQIKRIQILTTNSSGQQISTKSDAIVPGTTYYVRELTHKEGQLLSVIPKKTIYSVTPTATSASNPTWVRASGSFSIENVAEVFRFSIPKKEIINRGLSNFQGIQYKLTCVSLVNPAQQNSQCMPGKTVKKALGSSEDRCHYP